MKRYIKNTANNNTLEIVIDFYYDFDDKIEASFNPIMSQSEIDQEIDAMIEDNYMSFMDDVACKLVSLGFEILEGPNFSNRPGSKSCYFVVCNKHDYDELTVKLIMNIRISDHRLHKRLGENRNKNRFQARNSYYKRELENYLELNANDPGSMDYGLMEIIIGNNTFKTHIEAMNYIVNCIKKKMPI